MNVAAILASMLSGLESGIVTIVTAVLGIFIPELAKCTAATLVVIGNNFRAFLSAIASGTPWGEALADMMTADFNEISDDEKQLAIDFSEAVATALEKAGMIPQGK